MSKKWVFCLIFMFTAGSFFLGHTSTTTAEVIQLNYKILESYATDIDTTILVKLKAKNTTTSPIYDAKGIVSYVNNITIDVNQVYFGDINPGQNIESTETFTISLKNSSSQEPLQKEILWQIEYTDVNGDSVFEKISLK